MRRPSIVELAEIGDLPEEKKEKEKPSIILEPTAITEQTVV